MKTHTGITRSAVVPASGLATRRLVCVVAVVGTTTSGSATAFGEGHAGAGLARFLTVALLRS